MSSDILASLVEIKPNLGGAHGGKGFSYQCHWAICKLIDLHRTRKTYVLVMDYHEDVVVSHRDPNVQLNPAEFYQIKKRENKRAWTVTGLLKGEDNESSPLVKVCNWIHKFSSKCDIKVFFVSNGEFSLSVDEKDVTNGLVGFGSLPANEQSRIVGELRQKYDGFEFPQLKTQLWFQQTDLQPKTAKDTTISRLQALLEEEFQKGGFRSIELYNRLATEIRNMLDNTTLCSTIDQLLAQKCIDSTSFSTILRMADKVGANDRWDRFERKLEDRFSAPYIKRIRRGWSDYQVDRIDSTNALARATGNAIKAYFDTITTADDGSDPAHGMFEVVNEGLRFVRAKLARDAASMKDWYLAGAILAEWEDWDPQ